MTNQDTYLELAFENMLSNIYGASGSVPAGWTKLPLLKKTLSRLFSTLAHALRRNVNGDPAHKAALIQTCNDAITAVKQSRGKDETTQLALTYCFRLSFLLLGRMPHNWRKSRAGWRSKVDLSNFRTLCYVRTSRQRIAEIINYAYQLPNLNEGSLFDRLIGQRRKHPDDDDAVLDWIRENEPGVFAMFNKA